MSEPSKLTYLKQLAAMTEYSPEMQRYYLACLEEFGEGLIEFVAELTYEA